MVDEGSFGGCGGSVPGCGVTTAAAAVDVDGLLACTTAGTDTTFPASGGGTNGAAAGGTFPTDAEEVAAAATADLTGAAADDDPDCFCVGVNVEPLPLSLSPFCVCVCCCLAAFKRSFSSWALTSNSLMTCWKYSNISTITLYSGVFRQIST